MSARTKRQNVPSTQLLFDENPESMMVADAETLEILEVNRAAISKYGYSHDEFRTLCLTDLVPVDDRERVAPEP